MNSGKDTKESGIGRFTGRVMSAWQHVSRRVERSAPELVD